MNLADIYSQEILLHFPLDEHLIYSGTHITLSSRV